jgi:uncharacterized protein YigA (DUF484 family)
MSRLPRDHGADRAAITAAADRLLTGTPLRSASGNLTQTELIAEAGLRRDIVYAHRDLVDQFKARVRNQHSTPAVMQALADQNAALTSQLRDLTADLAHERTRTATIRRLAAELSLELQQAREELIAVSAVTALHRPRRQQLPAPGR